jgi:tetratricopeptide (TPR) repeat protein
MDHRFSERDTGALQYRRSTNMIRDQHENTLVGANAEAACFFDQAVESFSLYRGDPVALATQAIQAAPQFSMARVFMAWLALIATEPTAAAGARALMAELEQHPRDERIDAHLGALRCAAAGQWTAGAQLLERYSSAYPRDFLALQVGHLLDFLRADARSLRDRIASALPHWSPDMPGFAQLLGMYAFGLEETGDHARAEAYGRRAVTLQPLDAWGHHAVAHVMEMQGRAEDGIGWMIAREPFWGAADNSFKVHNWWHRALFHLDLGQHEEALAIYDGPVREARSAVAYDMIDASAMLWRLQLLGVDVGGRWQELAQAWDALADGRSYAFNDWHAVMAWLGAGRERDVERLAKDWRDMGAASTENDRWAVEIGLPLVEGFNAFWRRDYATAVDRLHKVRRFACAFGGSNAQRDIIDWTLTESAIRGGDFALSQALVQERLALKPHSVTGRAMLARAATSVFSRQRAA